MFRRPVLSTLYLIQLDYNDLVVLVSYPETVLLMHIDPYYHEIDSEYSTFVLELLSGEAPKQKFSHMYLIIVALVRN